MEGSHLGRLTRWTPEVFEWEPNPRHYSGSVELCGLEETLKDSNVPTTKSGGKGLHNVIGELSAD